MIPADLANPFIKQQVGNEWKPPPGNVPDLHREVLGRCRRLLRDVRASGVGSSLMIVGEQGSGKTHLISQLRSELANDHAALVVRLPMNKTYVGQIWRYLRARLVSDLLQKGWHPKDADATGLGRILRNRFPKWGSGGLTRIITGTNLADELQLLLADLSAECELTYELRQALPRLWDGDKRVASVAADYLRGKSLSEGDSKRLGLPAGSPTDYEQEQTSRDLVLSFMRLAGDKTTLFVCFDEVEALLSGASDDVALREFAALVADLIAEPGPRVVTTFVRPRTIIQLRESAEKSCVRKMSQVEAAIPPIDQWEDLVKLVLARLQSDEGCRRARAHQRDPYWPLGEHFLRNTLDQHRRELTARHLFTACAHEFERLQSAGPSRPITTSPPPVTTQNAIIPWPPLPNPDVVDKLPVAARVTVVPPPPPPKPDNESVYKAFNALWDSRRTHHLTHLTAVRFEVVCGAVLPWLAHLLEIGYQQDVVKDNRIGDVNLLFRPTSEGLKPVAVSYCNQDPRRLWPRLNKLIQQAQAGRANGLFGHLALLRLADDPLSDTAREKFDMLRRGGSLVVMIPKEQLAELAAYHDVLEGAKTGNLRDKSGKQMEVEDYNRWAKVAVSPGAKGFTLSVFEVGKSSTPEASAKPPLAEHTTARTK